MAFSRNDAETEESFAEWYRPLNRTGSLESKRQRTEGVVPSLDRVWKYAKGTDGHTRPTERFEYFSSNQWSSTQIRNYQDLNLPNAYFSATDRAMHRSYKEKFETYNKREGYSLKDLMFNISDKTLAGGTCKRVDEGRTHPKKSIDEFHHERLHRSPCGNFIIDHKKNSNGIFVRNSNRKRHGDHLNGQRAKRNMPSENQSKESCYPKKDWQSYPHGNVSHSGFDLLRNDDKEGNTKKLAKGGQNGESGMLSSKYSSKTIMSPNGPKQSEGSNNIKLRV
uniref:Uncharacterized protein n=1 Tax=Leersia perrieri TaxID=77586 RepID=A0A0D9VW12_9ORYZ